MNDAFEAAAVICAAGSSARMGGLKKEYRTLNNSGNSASDSLTVLGCAVLAFASVPSIETIVIAIPPDGEAQARKALPSGILSGAKPNVLFAAGGSSRRASVFNALSLLAASARIPRYVLIHDGARPWVSPSLIERVLSAVRTRGAVIPALTLTETPKELKAEGGEQSCVFIERHLKRANICIAQTPQAFKFPEIFAAHEKAAALAGEDFTDDAEVWGRFCGQVAVISGEQENRKITFPEDIN